MATGRTTVLQQLRETLLPLSGGGLTDGQLLGQFVAHRDERAFAALVRRHGPMVLAVCRRLLRHTQDAEDAFQATFLVLARKAPSMRDREAVGSWLSGAARLAALKARSMNARRRKKEQQVEDMPHPQVRPKEPDRELLALLDAEVGRLPEKYRLPVVLCELEGRTRREVARQLGLPEGTLSSRLATARKLLAKRLARCGTAFSAAGLVAALSQEVSAALPPHLVSSTVRAALGLAAGKVAAVTTPAAVLMKGVLKSMFLAKLKTMVTTAALVVALGAAGQAPGATGAGGGKPRTELEALRRENELLKLNLEVVLEKVRAQEAELRGLRTRPAAKDAWVPLTNELDLSENRLLERVDYTRRHAALLGVLTAKPEPDPVQELEVALKALRGAKDPKERRLAADVLEKALKSLREKLNKEGAAPAQPGQ
jgi:RNA polymerase sigma factor (sigma-70 family)